MGVDKEKLRRALQRQKLAPFSAKALSVVEPSTFYEHNWHIDCVCEHLEAVWYKQIKRLIINIPPRSLKTHLASVSFPAWGFGQDPTIKFMLTSYKFDLAKRMTRKTRGILESAWFKDLYPDFALSKEQNEKHYFETSQRGQYFSAAMSSVTGEGADIQICDDPLNPTESSSQVQRLNAIDTIRNTLFSRFNDARTGRFILIMQRLHEEDPTGELLKDEGWTHLKLPAEAVGKSYSYSANGKTWKMEQGDLLFPERFTKEILAKKAIEMGAYNYAGQMLQEPAPIGGGEIKKEYLNYYNVSAFDASDCNLYITVDPAKGEEDAVKNDNDYTAMCVWALAPDQNYYLVDGVRDRLNPTERVNRIFELHKKWSAKTNRSPKVGWENIGLHGDIHFIKQKQNEINYRFPIIELPPKGMRRLKKIPKIRRLVPLFEEGKIWMPSDLFYKDHNGLSRNFINDIVEQEILLFPFAPHDDFMDAMSMLLDMNPIFPKMRNKEVFDEMYEPQSMSVFDL